MSLPEGWIALAGDDHGLRAGPPGRAVLRIDPRLGHGSELPKAAALTGGIQRELQGAKLVLLEQHESGDLTWVRYTLLGPGKASPGAPAFLGAKRVENDLYLCASFPGATAEEVLLAIGACSDLQKSRR